MARMYPPQPRVDTKSPAEREYFEIMKNELSSDWIVLHSLGLTNHPKKPWAEIDFVLIGPDGVFCLEVKGGRVFRSDGQYYTENRYGIINALKESPFEQVGSGSSALYKYLLTNIPWIQKSVIGYGVITPDCRWNINGTDVIPEAVYDIENRRASFSSFRRRLVNYWYDRMENDHRHTPVSLRPIECEQILEVLRGDFDLRQSLKDRVGQVHDELIQPTKQQYRILDQIDENERILISGGAGTGKTLLAVEAACRYASTKSLVLYCCASKPLAKYVAHALADQPNVHVTDVRTLMDDLIDRAGLRDDLPNAEEADMSAVFLPHKAAEAAEALGNSACYDALIVDEAQDLLSEPYLFLFNELLKNNLENGTWLFLRDPFQDILLGTSPVGIELLNKMRPAKSKLTVNCRNTRRIAAAAEILSGVHIPEVSDIVGLEPEYKSYGDDAEQRRELTNVINKILGQHVLPSDIVLLSSRPFRQSIVRNGLDDVPLSITEVAQDSPLPPKTIRFSTIADFKGLESKVIIVTDIDDLTSEAGVTAVYIGATRATAYLVVLRSKTVDAQYEQHGVRYSMRIMKKANK